MSIFGFLMPLYAIVFTGAGGVRAAAVVILLPGMVSRRPAVHATQAALLALVMLYAVSYVARPIG